MTFNQVEPVYEEGKNGEYWYKAYSCERYMNGYLHSTDDKPALERHDCETQLVWFKNGFKHRENKPADITFSYDDEKDCEIIVNQHWYIDGKLHRADGPAVINFAFDRCYKEWWVNGELTASACSFYTAADLIECHEFGTPREERYWGISEDE